VIVNNHDPKRRRFTLRGFPSPLGCLYFLHDVAPIIMLQNVLDRTTILLHFKT